MKLRTPNKLAMQDAILVAMLDMSGPMSYSDAVAIVKGHNQTTTLRMLVAEDVIFRHAGGDSRTRRGRYDFTFEGRAIAIGVRRRLIEAGLIDPLARVVLRRTA